MDETDGVKWSTIRQFLTNRKNIKPAHSNDFWTGKQTRWDRVKMRQDSGRSVSKDNVVGMSYINRQLQMTRIYCNALCINLHHFEYKLLITEPRVSCNTEGAISQLHQGAT